MGKEKNNTEKVEATKNEATTSVETVAPIVKENLQEKESQENATASVESKTPGANENTETTETTETESVETVAPIIPVLAPNEVIEVKDKPILKASNGNVMVKTANATVEVSPLTAKIISKFKK